MAREGSRANLSDAVARRGNPSPFLDIETLGEAMRPEPHIAITSLYEHLRLSREERDYIAGHALESIALLGGELSLLATDRDVVGEKASDRARKTAALSNLLGDIGWEREGPSSMEVPGKDGWNVPLGELFPVAQLRPWLEEWQRQDSEALIEAERKLEVKGLEDPLAEGYEIGMEVREQDFRQAVADAQTKLSTGAILLARIEKWMASRGN